MHLKKYILFCFVTITVSTKAQCPLVSCPSVLSLTTCNYIGQSVTASSNYSANISSRWFGPGGIPLFSTGTSTSQVNINCVGTYTVLFKDNISSCVVTSTLTATNSSLAAKPTFSVITPGSFSQTCTNSIITINLINASTYPSPGGPLSYTLLPPNSPTYTYNSVFGGIGTYTYATCGSFYAIVCDNSSLCMSSINFAISCGTLAPTPITILGSNMVCLGSSVTYTALANSIQNWSTGANTFTLNALPTTNTVYLVNGTDLNGCTSTGTVSLATNSTCSQVWPGDANSDGTVNSNDVLEIGLASSSTGAPRTTTSIVYASEYASNWTGTVSTGKNKCHADCNGDGIVNNTDLTAISNNFGQNHAFRNTSVASSNADLRLIPSQAIFNAGGWNKADIMLGDSVNTISQLYGLVFDIDFDKTLIESDSVFIRYVPSFISAGNAAIEFNKLIFANAKNYAATVRTDGVNVNGYGKIAEVFFKVKYDLPLNSNLNLSLSNVGKINASGIPVNLSGGGASVGIDNNAVGVVEHGSISNQTRLFPNPANEEVKLINTSSKQITFSLFDLLGRKLREGNFTNSTSFNLSEFANGSYVLKFDSGSEASFKKLIIEH